jgi:hypothetical protein
MKKLDIIGIYATVNAYMRLKRIQRTTALVKYTYRSNGFQVIP